MKLFFLFLKASILISVIFISPVSAANRKPVKIVNAFPKLVFQSPTDIQSVPDGSGRLFVVEKRGTIRSFRNDPNVSDSDLFLDIVNRVNSRGYEEGLLGLAFHPRFAEKGEFFVYYTASSPSRNVLSRFRVGAANSHGNAESETIILEVPDPYSNHNGGQIVFGRDGYLYVGLGDGGSAGDPHGNGQSLRTLLGKILRIDVNKAEGGRPYAVPKDNPFIGHPDKMEEIYAFGIRNPWRFSFDSETGSLWLADVGQNKLEEIDIVEKGKNYGWNIMEGTQCFKPPAYCDRSGLTLPVYEYGRHLGQSITGGFVYRGKSARSLSGYYVYADYMTGRIWALKIKNGVKENFEISDTDLAISTFGVDDENELYFAAFNGKIYKFQEQ